MSLKKSASLAFGAMLATLAVTSAVLPAAAHAKELTQVRFAVDPTYPPFESKLADGSLAGFDIDLGNALCAQMKLKCVWVENSFDGMIPGLKARKFDAVLSDMGITEERLKQIDFTQPLYDTDTQLVARRFRHSADAASAEGQAHRRGAGHRAGALREDQVGAVRRDHRRLRRSGGRSRPISSRAGSTRCTPIRCRHRSAF
ncbi:transporter substrate-binding domain-containing protein [Candidatus Burkholderia verschuerenii]|uniref:transporter substrate-binding domain-containing protein n=1 Tax=Candidatus Burkholderia verschuerenii TaxID=242163 RepID=UPI000AAC41EA